MLRPIIILSPLLFVGACVARTDEPRASESDVRSDRPPRWTHSTGNDSYGRVLALRTNRFGGTYALDQPIPVAIEIKNLGPPSSDSPHPRAQLFPHLEVWLQKEDTTTVRSYPIDIENRIRIKRGQKFAHIFDLRKLLELSASGTYRVRVGHANHVVRNLGDWTGKLQSQQMTVIIHDRERESVRR